MEGGNTQQQLDLQLQEKISTKPQLHSYWLCGKEITKQQLHNIFSYNCKQVWGKSHTHNVLVVNLPTIP